MAPAPTCLQCWLLIVHGQGLLYPRLHLSQGQLLQNHPVQFKLQRPVCPVYTSAGLSQLQSSPCDWPGLLLLQLPDSASFMPPRSHEHSPEKHLNPNLHVMVCVLGTPAFTVGMCLSASQCLCLAYPALEFSNPRYVLASLW